MSFIGKPPTDTLFETAYARANSVVQTGFTTINVAASNTGSYTNIRANTNNDVLLVRTGRGVSLTSNANTDTLTLTMSGDLGVAQTAATRALSTWSWITGTLSTRELLDITWSPELRLFAATANGVNGNIVTSPDGFHWTHRDADVPKDTWSGITWSPELRIFVAVSAEGVGNRAMTSANGITWVTGATPVDNGWIKCIWVKELGLFVAMCESTGAADGTKRIMTSPDGIAWTGRTTTIEDAFCLAWSKDLGLLVVLGESGSNQMMTSPDGIIWTARALPAGAATKYFSGVVWSPELGLFVALGDAAMTSRNGLTWTVGTFPGGISSIEDVVWVPHFRAFVGVVHTGSFAVVISFDGSNWTPISALNGTPWLTLTWSPELGILVAVGIQGTSRVMSSKKMGLWGNINTRLTPAQVTTVLGIGA